MNAKRWIIVVGTVSALAMSGALAFGAETEADLFQKSYDSEAVGKVADALAALDRLPPARSASYVAELRRGWLLYKLGKSSEALEAYTRAIALQPGAVEVRTGALLPQMGLRRWADAESNAREVLRVDPGNYLANLRLAFTVYSLGRYPEAEVLYRRLLALYPSDVDVRAGLGWSLVKLGKLADAAKEFREVLAIAPHNLLALDGLKATGSTN